MDIGQTLKNTENALRDFVTQILSEKYGDDWMDKLGVTKERLDNWQNRKDTDKLSKEERLIYYADFYDLEIIIVKNWEIFKEVFDNKKILEVYLGILEGFRNTDAHRRELLPYQMNLVDGICGEIRSKLIKYRSKKETGEDCFARFEFAQDNMGNSWKAGDNTVETGLTLRPGDIIEFVATASDPEGNSLEYRLLGKTDWQESNKFIYTITEEDIDKRAVFIIKVRGKGRNYYADKFSKSDDNVVFAYKILPKK